MRNPSTSLFASLVLLAACPGDDGPAVDTDASSSTSGSATAVTLPLTDTLGTVSDTTADSSSGSTGSSSSEGSSTSMVDGTTTTEGSSTDGTTGIDLSVWEADFASGLVIDPEDDDQGPGTYVYPMGVDGGSSDLRSFELDYSAADSMLHFTLGLTSITENTRIGMLLLDEPAWSNAGMNVVFTVGGTEVRAPDWNASGVQLVLMDPDSPLFDFGAINDIDPFSDNPRPDNAIYLSESDGAPFLGADGLPSYSTANLQRLDVTVDALVDPNTMSFDVDANWLAPYFDTTGGNVYVAIWTYTLLELPMGQWNEIEFGALELTEALGGLPNAAMDNWRDCDAYDVMFFEGAYTQPDFLDVPVMFAGDPANTVVTFANVGEGVLEIPTM